MERSTNQRNHVPQTTPIMKQFPPPPPSKEPETSGNQRMPTVFDASTNRRLRGGQVGTPDSKCSQNKPCTGLDRERMKDMMVDSFSRHETIAILPGFKEDGRHGRTCIKVNSNSTNNQQITIGEKPPMGNAQWKAAQQQQQQPSIQKPQHFQVAGQRGPNNINCKPNGPGNHDTGANTGSPGQPWPYSQKSQQSIRETQAAYRRDLEKQIEEKRQCKDKNIRKSVSSSAARGEQVNNKPVNQSVSLEEFRNTGFLPSWFDPVKNNSLYNSNKVDQSNSNETSNDNQEATQEGYETVPPSPLPAMQANNVFMNSCAPRAFPEQNFAHPHQGHATGYAYAPHMEQSQPCDYYVVPKEMIDQMNRNNGCFPMQMEPMMQMFPTQHHQTFYGPPTDMQHDRGMAPPSGVIHIESSYQPMHSAQQHPNMPPAQMVQYIRAPQQFQRQVAQPVSHPSVSIFPFVQPSDHPQEIVGEIEDHQKVPFHPTSSHSQANENEAQCNLPPSEAQQFVINLRNLPPPPTPPCPQEHVLNLGPGKFGNRNPCKMLENMAEPVHNNEQGGDQTDHMPSNDYSGAQDEDSDGAQGEEGARSQESGREGEEETEEARDQYKAELARQIEEKKRKQQELLMKEEEKNAKFERKIQEDQKRMIEEYEEEQRKQKLQHEELVKRQEAFLKERERYEREAELERLKKQAASNRAQVTPRVTPRQPEQGESEGVLSGRCTPRIKVSESIHDEVLAEAKRRAALEGQVLYGSPRPRTVVICHSNSNPSDTRRQDVRGNGSNKAIDEAASGDAKVQSEGILFLSDLKKAIKAEDERMTRILSKKRPQIIASHYMS